MTALWIILGILALLVMLLLVKLALEFSWDGDTLEIYGRIGPVRIQLSDEMPASEPTTETAPAAKPASKHKGWGRKLRRHWREILKILSQVLKRPVVELLQVDYVAGGDPVAAAMSYGAAQAAWSALRPLFLSQVKLQREEVSIRCDFQRSASSLQASVRLTLRVYEVLAVAFSLLRHVSSGQSQSKSLKKAVQQK